MSVRRINLVARLIVITLLISIVGGFSSAYAAETLPKVEMAIEEYAKVREGDTQTFNIFSKYSGKVQYRVWICNRKGDYWQDITNGYTKPVDGKQVFTVTTPKLEEGEYGIAFWVKRAGAAPKNERGYDTVLGYKMFCLKNEGEKPNVKISNIKHNYSVGETMHIEKEAGKQYLYSYSVRDLISKKDIVPFKAYTDSVSWKANKEGVYLLKVNLKSIEKVEIPKPEEENVEDGKEPKSEENEEDTKLEDKIITETEKTGQVPKTQDEEAILEKDIVEENILEKNIEEEDIIKEEEVQYKEVERITQITRLVIVGDPFKPKAPITSTVPKGPTAETIKSLVVGNTSETGRIYIKAQPKSSSRNVGYIYGSLTGVKIIKTVGNFYCIEATDYASCKRVKGYVYKSQLKTIKPSGSFFVKVDLSEQRVYVFKNGKLARNIICSTGQDWTPTPTGTYLIGGRGSRFYTGYRNSVVCYNWVRFNYNFLFHSTLHTRSGYEIASEAKKLGSKASHGCIRMPLKDIKWFYNAVPKGTLLVIQQ